MFSFFSKKPKFTVRIKEYTTPLLIGGLWTEVHKKTLKKEIGSLQTRFQELRPNLKQLSDPKGTLVISRPAEPDGSFSYFIGELIDTAEQDSNFAVESLACGPLCPHQRRVSRPYRAYIGCGAGQAVLF